MPRASLATHCASSYVRILQLDSAAPRLRLAVWLSPYAARFARDASRLFFRPHTTARFRRSAASSRCMAAAICHALRSRRIAPLLTFAYHSSIPPLRGFISLCGYRHMPGNIRRCQQASLHSAGVSRRMRTSLLQKVAGRILRPGRFLQGFLLQFL